MPWVAPAAHVVEEAEEADPEQCRRDAAVMATSGSRVGNPPAMSAMAMQSATPIAAASVACAELKPKMEPNSTVAYSLLFPVLLDVAQEVLRNRTPRPRTHVNTVPMTTSSGWPWWAEQPEEQPHPDRGREQSDVRVDAERERCHRAGERERG